MKAKKKNDESRAVDNIVRRRWKKDKRLQQGWWVPGDYLQKCIICNEDFIGDKRARHCADCAYKIKEEIEEPEHDQLIQLKERYKMSEYYINLFKFEHKKLFDWVNENYPDIMQEYMNRAI